MSCFELEMLSPYSSISPLPFPPLISMPISQCLTETATQSQRPRNSSLFDKLSCVVIERIGLGLDAAVDVAQALDSVSNCVAEFYIKPNEPARRLSKEKTE